MWLLNKPDPQEMQRQEACRSWGITDAGVLAKCRQSRELEAAAIEPFKRSAVEREIAEFNQDLSALASGKTHATETDYPTWSIEEVEKVVGGALGLIIDPKDSATFSAKGRPAKVFGIIVTNEPDPEDNPDERAWKPRYFTLETVAPPPSEIARRIAANEEFMPETVNLDIESLNRHERQFIIDHCHSLSVTPCRATVLGHIDEIVGLRDLFHTTAGIVADQVDIQPLEWSTAFPDGFPSMRSLIEQSKSGQSTDP